MPEREEIKKIDAPKYSAAPDQHIGRRYGRGLGAELKDINVNMNAAETFLDRNPGKTESLWAPVASLVRINHMINEASYAMKVRSREVVYTDALKQMEKVHVKVALNPADPAQKNIFDVIKKAGIDVDASAQNRPHFIMELKDNQKHTGNYVAYNPKTGKYELYFQKKMFFARLANFAAIHPYAKGKISGGLWFKNKESYHAHIAKKADQVAADMLKAPVDHKLSSTRDLSVKESMSNYFGMRGISEIPEGIALIEMSSKGKLQVIGNPYMKATARELLWIEQSEKRRKAAAEKAEKERRAKEPVAAAT